MKHDEFFSPLLPQSYIIWMVQCSNDLLGTFLTVIYLFRLWRFDQLFKLETLLNEMCSLLCFWELKHFKACFTIYFHFTEVIVSIRRIPIRKRFVSSVVVIDDVSPGVRTCYVDRIWYCWSGVVGVPETQYSVLFAWSGRNVDGESKKIFTLIILFIW